MARKNWLFVVAILAVSTIGFAQTAAPAGRTKGKTTPQSSQTPVAATKQPTPSVVTQKSSEPVAASADVQANAASATATTGVAAEGEGFVAPREEVAQVEQPSAPVVARVTFNPKNKRDPTLSPDDILLIEYREQERLYAIELEEERKREEERRKKAEAERQRQLELERARDPSKDIRNKIHISGVIGQEVFIGKKVYTIGDRVLGARIEEVHPEYVIFVYKGQHFRRNVKL